jgi:hypothetical protein
MTAATDGETTNEDRVALGERLGLFEAMSDSHVTPRELARRTETPERFLAEWLAEQADAGYLTYDSVSGRYATHSDLPRAA